MLQSGGDVVIDRCTHCQGLWFDSGEAERLKGKWMGDALDTGSTDEGKKWDAVEDVAESTVPTGLVRRREVRAGEPASGQLLDAGHVHVAVVEEVMEPRHPPPEKRPILVHGIARQRGVGDEGPRRPVLYSPPPLGIPPQLPTRPTPQAQARCLPQWSRLRLNSSRAISRAMMEMTTSSSIRVNPPTDGLQPLGEKLVRLVIS